MNYFTPPYIFEFPRNLKDHKSRILSQAWKIRNKYDSK